MTFKNSNSQGKVFYGMHMYPGVAEYHPPQEKPYRVLVNEETIREMGPTFQGRPVFVKHVDGVADNIDVLKNEADGWVVESFFNESDGRHWVKFLVCSQKGEEAIRRGWKLSNCYTWQKSGPGGTFSGVDYQKQVMAAEYEHLAIVPNPRYNESEILSPEQFKEYNASKVIELQRLKNSLEEQEPMFFNKTKVANSSELEKTLVVLPKSKREVSLTTLVNEADESEEKKKTAEYGMAHPDHMVNMGDGKKMSVKDMMDSHKKMSDELEAMKKNASEKEEGLETESTDVEVEGDEAAVENKEDGDVKATKEADPEKEVKAEKAKNAADKKAAVKPKADALRTANAKGAIEERSVELSAEKVARGQARYGSSK